MTDLTKATRFLADQIEKNGQRKKENKPTFSVTTRQVKVNIKAASCSGVDFGPKTPRLYYFFTFPLVKKKVAGWGARVFGAPVCTPSVLRQRS